uniref:Uncharacterized protein n=1 Tax=Panagrolaimus sp. ES5 TaxID=591445 RepID=A0AC34FZ24_9BILA
MSKVEKIDSIEKAKNYSSILRETLIVLKKRAAEITAIDKSNFLRYVIEKTVDKMAQTREEANFLAASTQFHASEMVSKSIYGSFYQDLTLSSTINLTLLSVHEASQSVPTEDDLKEIDKFVETTVAKKRVRTYRERDVKTYFTSAENANGSAVYLRHILYAMEKRANGDFSKVIFKVSGQHYTSKMIDSAINTKEFANLIVAFCRISAAKIVAKYPPQIAVFFTDMTLSYKDASLKISWN